MAEVIRIIGLEFQSCHGALPHEADIPQGFAVDVEIDAKLQQAGASDALADTVDYGKVCQMVADVMNGPVHRLLESLAASICQRILTVTRVQSVRVRVRKLAPPVSVRVQWVEVEWWLARDHG